MHNSNDRGELRGGVPPRRNVDASSLNRIRSATALFAAELAEEAHLRGMGTYRSIYAGIREIYIILLSSRSTIQDP